MASAEQNLLQETTDRRDALVAEREILGLEEQVRWLEQEKNQVLSEDWGDRVDSRGYLTDSPGFMTGGITHGHISRPEDRLHGDNVPFWQTETEHAEIRGMARVLTEVDEIGIGIVDNLTNYVIGEDGFSYACIPEGGDTGLAESCQRIIDDFLELNSVEADLDREVFASTVKDGECFLTLKEVGRGRVRVRLEEPDFITQPLQTGKLEDMLSLPPGLDWKYGIATDEGDVTRVHGYFVQRFGNAGDWDFVDESHMCHIKVGVGRNVKRGMSEFYAPQGNLSRAGKVVKNTATGAASQASIAYIKEHAPGTTKGSVEAATTGSVAHTFKGHRNGGGTRSHNVEDIYGGRIINTNAGMKYHAGPMGQPRGGNYLEVAAGVFRVVGARWNMPEYMVSGDASNANYSSTLVAESPFVKSAGAKQGFYKRQFVAMLWKVIAIAKSAGRLPGGMSMAELKRRVTIEAKSPDIAVRDKIQDHTIRTGQHESGLLSLESWADEEGIDYEQEIKRGAKRVEPAGATGQATAISAALESVQTTGEAKLILREVYP